MGITENQNLLHWSYFLALEADMEKLSRYIEFTSDNYEVYSIELAHILLASSSEVDVVAKQLCSQLEPENNASNIKEYRKILRKVLPELEQAKVTLPRYGLELEPWSNWSNNNTPNWWRSHNKVKHERHDYFTEANLKNTLNAMSGLFLIVLYYYRGYIENRRIEPPPSIFTPPAELANVSPTLGGRMALFFCKQE